MPTEINRPADGRVYIPDMSAVSRSSITIVDNDDSPIVACAGGPPCVADRSSATGHSTPTSSLPGRHTLLASLGLWPRSRRLHQEEAGFSKPASSLSTLPRPLAGYFERWAIRSVARPRPPAAIYFCSAHDPQEEGAREPSTPSFLALL